MFKKNTAVLVWRAQQTHSTRLEAQKAQILAYFDQPSSTGDIYAEKAVFALAQNMHVAEALRQIERTARWFELPHPTGRDPKGESTFAALGLVSALYRAGDRLTDGVRAAIDHFFLRRNFESMYESENHRLLHHTAVYLAAQFYQDQYFTWAGKFGRDITGEEEAFLEQYIDFRARRSWGEFDSCGYLAVDFNCLLDLRDFSQNARLRKLAEMMLDLLLIDMAVDSRDGLYGGAHGRIYPPSAMNAAVGGMQSIYGLYFDGAHFAESGPAPYRCLLSDYRPDPVVYQLMLGKEGAYINREAKHLHCIPNPPQQEGSISKYTFVTPSYIIGAVNRQDNYLPDSPQRWYAHHEQHELDALILSHPRAKVFTHHPGDFKEHNQWTGDLRCGCVQSFCDLNVAMATYDIGPKQMEYINAYLCESVMDEVRTEGKWVFCARDGVYIALYGSNGWHYSDFRSTEDGSRCELISEGRKHACVIEISDAEESLDAFIARICGNLLEFDEGTMELCYTSGGRTRKMRGQEREINALPVRFPYDTFDSPYVRAKAGENRIFVTGLERRVVYDFARAAVVNLDEGKESL